MVIIKLQLQCLCGVDRKHTIRICTPAKVQNISNPTLVLSFCFSLFIMIMMCQLSKCLFCVWVQRTDEVYDDRKSTQKRQTLCQICNGNRWDNNWITSERRDGAGGCCILYLQCCILYRLINTDEYRCLVQSQCVSLCSAFAWSSGKYLVTFLIVFDVFLCCFKRTNKYLGICTSVAEWCMCVKLFLFCLVFFTTKWFSYSKIRM